MPVGGHPRIGEQLAVGLHIRVAGGEKNIAVEDRIGPRLEAEDLRFPAQSIHNSSDVTAFEAQMQVEPVLQRARAAKEAGADRFCMGWAWREIRDGAPFEAMLDMVRGCAAWGWKPA